MGRISRRGASGGSRGAPQRRLVQIAATLLCAAAAASPGIGGGRRATPQALPAGLALARAQQAVERGEAEAALAAFAALAEAHPVVADYADLQRMRLLRAGGDVVAARQIAARWLAAPTPLAADFETLAAELAASAGDREAALAGFERALRQSPDAERSAQLLLRIAALHEDAGRADQAAHTYLRLWSEQPTQAAAAEAEQRLAQLEAAAGRELRSAADFRLRGDACFDANRNEEALAAYQQLLARSDASASDRARAQSQSAETLFRLRRYAEATAAFAALPRSAEQRIAWARSRARAGDPLGAARALAKLAERERGRQGERARLLAAQLYAGEGESRRARALLAKLESRGRSEFAREARWQLAWSAFAEGRDAEAARRLGALVAAESDPLEELRARYWHARALQRRQDARGAEQLTRLAREYPFSYYGWRAAERLLASGAADPPRAAAHPLPPGSSQLADSDFERAQIFLEAGLRDQAGRELALLQDRGRSLADRLRLAQLLAEAGNYHAAQQLIVDAYGEPLARGPEPKLLDLWWHAWPLPYAAEVSGSAAAEARHGLRPELVYAIMREESGYRPGVLSVSGARGLLQLMPETGRRVAAGIALVDFQPDDLFAPPVNIRLGAAYLGELLERFDGRLSAVIASYNAGPESVARWLAQNPLEDDVWVEAIPYDQTRAYVKRVLRSLHAYRTLY